MKVIDSILNMARGGKPPTDTPGQATTSASLNLTPPDASDYAAVISHIRSLLGPIRTSMGGFERPAQPGVPVETFAGISAASHEPLATAGETATVRRLDGEHQTCWDLANSLTPAAARAAYDAQQQAAASRARVGAGRDAADMWTREDFEEDYRTRSHSARKGAQDALLEAKPIILDIAARFRAFAQQAIDDELVAEYKRFQKYGIKFEVSQLVRTLSACLDSLDKHMPSDRKLVRPRNAMALFNISLD